MPEISRFFGIIIRMYFDDHDPPHFHAIYGETEAQIRIDPINLLHGNLPGRAFSDGCGVGRTASARTQAQLATLEK